MKNNKNKNKIVWVLFGDRGVDIYEEFEMEISEELMIEKGFERVKGIDGKERKNVFMDDDLFIVFGNSKKEIRESLEGISELEWNMELNKNKEWLDLEGCFRKLME